MQKINAVVLIPARLGATRLPNKPLVDIVGKPMIEHVLRRGMASGLGPVYVATPDLEIKAVVEAAGGKAVMTSNQHQTGSDRVFEALHKIDPDKQFDVIVNLQGDLPLIKPENLKKVIEPLLADEKVDVSTLASEIQCAEDKLNPNVVKIALELHNTDSKMGRALYFSRSLIPQTLDDQGPYYHHIGVYAFRRKALERFMDLPQSLLEKKERLEQLRALACGMRIDVALIDQIPQSVDTMEDLEQVRRQASV